MAKILVGRATDPTALALLDQRGDVDYEIIETPTVADLEARIAEFDAILLGMTPFTEAVVTKATRLKVVSRFGVGYDNIDVGALTTRCSLWRTWC